MGLMKSTHFLLLLFFIFCASYSFAAFPVKHASEEDRQIITTHQTSYAGEIQLSEKNHSPAFHLSDWFRQKNIELFPVRRKSSVHGILSLIFGIIGLFPLDGLLFSIAAIVLGAIGISHHERYALAGLILGIAGIVISAIFLILVLSVISGIALF
jgi:hypothetical protein